MTPHLLIIPGLGDSDEKHWQSYWLQKFTNSTKVIQDNWDEPQLSEWLARLNETIKKINEPTILVAHSLAVSLIMHWAAQNSSPNIIGAMLVAPADVDSPAHTPDFLRHFSPIPTQTVSFPTLVIGTENDTYMSLERAKELATHWGSDFINIGQLGHINSDSNLEYWEEGQNYLQLLIKKIT
ncbi:RBBP9/YdeN family alpha/beta hydrolase [Flavobacterium sp. HJJ]|uniref:RBBP9/YdeN family alpha/beta hydrolase n=1 Tax=Flavobacterium sp. HJJ TaxID=2783792 RepID=UPI00188CC61D|nr:alpha/beta hydrolase [Flavobacterium sp. HJJ]MBF4470027.1 alpha/beta hydrolase [Flavobacterium sp. HJJ]